MCGIVGYVGSKPVVPVLMDGLKRLAYRGYDSAGIAVAENGALHVRRSAGKLARLEDLLDREPVRGDFGVGHTRWATHGRPTEDNAHPHRDCRDRLVVVHNGIVENFLELKKELIGKGHRFRSDTDTEVVAHLLEPETPGERLDAAVRRALPRLRGLFALVVMSADEPDTVIAVRHGPPVIVGFGDREYFVASDVPAILAHTRDVVFLHDHEIAIVTPAGVRFGDFDGQAHDRSPQRVDWNAVMAEKAGYRHFMLKEIHEQPSAIRETLAGRLSPDHDRATITDVVDDEALASADRVMMLACGTSWHAGLVGKFVIEKLARIPVDVDYSSEFRYRMPAISERTLAVGITQSGETADTLGALREAKRLGARTVVVCNVVGSMAAREADGTLHTRAGPEIGVASTKAFTTQLVALELLGLALGRAKGTLADLDTQEILNELDRLPAHLETALTLNDEIARLATSLTRQHSALFLGRGLVYPIALEGALKLKEISYIHAEGYPAGEMKHGPIALIDEGFPVIALAPPGPLFEKTLGNIQEAKARGGRIIAVTMASARRSCEAVLDSARDAVLTVPDVHDLIAPIVFAIPMQLLAYHVAVQRGCDVDQPRNLAKSVTVE